MTELLCTIIGVLSLIIGIGVRQWWRAENERDGYDYNHERDAALKQADYDGWMP